MIFIEEFRFASKLISVDYKLNLGELILAEFPISIMTRGEALLFATYYFKC
jgi:hypothetical protein